MIILCNHTVLFIVYGLFRKKAKFSRAKILPFRLASFSGGGSAAPPPV
jgi:hypothetical protein